MTMMSRPTGDLKISRHPRGYVLEAAVEVSRPREEVFGFFADAKNLELLTPPFLSFQIVTPDPIAMRTGALIDYRIKVRHLALRWRTEILAWEPPTYFIDNQIKGPYRRWQHEHRFTETRGGTLCEDRVEYSVFGGALIHALIVRRDVEAIFRYRAQKLRELFPSAAVPGGF